MKNNKTKSNILLEYKKAQVRILVSILFFSLFLGIGYAKIANINLAINGNAIAQHQEGIFVSNIQYSSSSQDVDIDKSNVVLVMGTTVQSTIELGNDENSYITYNVSVFNSTSDEYAFISADVGENWYSNSNIVYKDYINGISKYDVVSPNSGKQFTVTFKYKNGVDFNSQDFSNSLDAYINFRFRKVYHITYSGSIDNTSGSYQTIYPIYNDSDSDSKTLTINFGSNAPTSISVTGNQNVVYTLDTDYTYNDGILNFPNGIRSDITIDGTNSSSGAIQNNEDQTFNPDSVPNGSTVVFNSVEGKPEVTKDENGNITEFKFSQGETVTLGDDTEPGVDTGFVPFPSGKNFELKLKAIYPQSNKSTNAILLDVRDRTKTSQNSLQFSYASNTSPPKLMIKYGPKNTYKEFKIPLGSGDTIDMLITYKDNKLTVVNNGSTVVSNGAYNITTGDVSIYLGYTIVNGNPVRKANATIQEFYIKEIE